MKHIRISPFCLPVLAMVILMRAEKPFFFSYVALLLHEGVHLLFLCKHKIILHQLRIEPFGIGILTENEPPTSVLVYVSAPIFNVMLSGILFWLHHRFSVPVSPDFFYANLFLGILNLLPCLPMDGGRAAELMLKKHRSQQEAQQILSKLSLGISAIMVVAGLWVWWYLKYHFSLFMIGIFLLYHSLCGNRLTLCNSIRQQINRKQQPTFQKELPIQYLGAAWNTPAVRLLKRFQGDCYYMVNVMKDGAVLKTLTETDIINAVLSSDSLLLLHEC